MLFAETTPYITYAFLGIMAATIGVLLLRTQRYYRRRRIDDDVREDEATETSLRGHRLDAPALLAQWEVQMHDTARELSSQLDTKMGILQQLIREADRAASRLEAALSFTHEETPAAESEFKPFSAASPSSDVSPIAPEASNAPPVSQAEGLKARGATETARLAPGKERAEEPSAAGSRYDEIYTLADYGFDAAEIARRVGSPIGEVQLILSLRKSR